MAGGGQLKLALNLQAWNLVENLLSQADTLRVAVHELPSGARIIDCGIDIEGGLAAGLAMARVCTAGLAEISITTAPHGPADGPTRWPWVQIVTDHPVAACMLSQYAGWQISVGKFFAMASGPMRAVAAREELFEKLQYREQSSVAVGVLEGRHLPDPSVVDHVAEHTGVPASEIRLLIAPTASQAGGVQVVSRSVETALHKLLELGFDLWRIQSGYGIAPLPPVAKDDLAAIGRTNDSILYAAHVVLWVRGDDESLAQIGPKVPSSASPDFGAPFAEVFKRYDHDFYKIDPMLFSPASITFQNLDTGRSHHFGTMRLDVLERSFLAG